MQRKETSSAEVILIAGPTASGKSALAMRIASRFRGRVINADAMQVYRDLSIVTARPTEEDMGCVPHALYGTVDGATNHSVRLWLLDAGREIARARAAGLVPILVGGTGLYFKALTQGLSDIPAVPSEVRADIRAWAKGLAPEALHAELTRRDPATAVGLRSTDPQRVLRALEVHAATGESLVAFHVRRERPTVDASRALAVALTVDRGAVRDRIDRRFDTMISGGALVEIEQLAARRLDATLPVMRAIGVPQLVEHLRGTTSLCEAVSRAKAASRQYVKRQETFLRHQLPDFVPVPAEAAEGELAQRLQSPA
jgi:tRNA dimethylallyltransferase